MIEFKKTMSSTLTDYTSSASAANETAAEIFSDELSRYTIVYPSRCTDMRMDIVNDIQDAIEHITNVRINAVPDSTPKSDKEIILASSSRSTSFDEEIKAFESRMDYVVAKDGNDIVLGGQNYYSDMRAAYDFIKNYLGYDCIEDSYSEPAKALSEKRSNIYKKPEFTIEAACWATKLDKESYIKDMADARFNMLMTGCYLSEQEMHNLTKWCAKYEINLMINISTKSDLPNFDVYSDCPAVWGAHVWDEPEESQFETVQKLVDEFNQKYAKYGLKPYVNYAGERADAVKQSPLLKNVRVMSFDWYIFVNNYPDGWCGTKWEGSYYLKRMQTFMNVAHEYGMDFWTYIQAYRRKGGIFNAEKAYRWQMYMNMCFDSKGMLYFMYANQSEAENNWGDYSTLVLNRDMTKSDNYYYAQKANEEILKAYDVLKDYRNVGAYTYFKRDSQFYAEFDEYKDFDVIEDIIDINNETLGNTSYLVGCFEKKDGTGKAFILMNLEIITDFDYDMNRKLPIKLKINGSKVTSCKNGWPKVMQPDADGYYSFLMPNGECVFVTIE